MLAELQPRKTARLGALLALLCILQVGIPATVEGQITCTCNSDRTFGSCRIKDIALTNPYPGEFPGPSLVVEQGGDAFVIVADFFSGETFIFSGADLLLTGPTLFPSPRGTLTTSGIAHEPENNR